MMQSVLATATQGNGHVRSSERSFQPEIQGLRALSVLAVVFAHAGLPGLAGGFIGVDVFFVISGFLITRLLLDEHARSGRIDLPAFWARRARRLLPNAFAALFGVLILSLLLFPVDKPATLAKEISFAALQMVNWEFADKAVDYFQSEDPASPVLHFWSLAVEEQFYLAWPLALAGAVLAFGRSVRRAVIVLLVAVWFASFTASVLLTISEPSFAYFGTGTRGWQLATGALLAACWPGVERLARRLRACAAWLGLAAIFAGIAVIEESSSYPGFWALLPTLGTAALIGGFGAAHPKGVLRRALSLPAMQWLGARSYSWYLWHWPLLALPRMTYPENPYIEIIAVPASLAVACLAYAWIEMPVRQGQVFAAAPLPTLAGAVVGLGLIVGTGHLYWPLLHLTQQATAARIAQVAEASTYASQLERHTCLLEGDVKQPASCMFGDLASDRDVVLFGDSHAGHWFDPIKAAAERTGWRLQVHTKSSCPSADVTVKRRDMPFRVCDEWREGVMEQLTGATRPDVVILSNLANHARVVYDPATGDLLDREQSHRVWREGYRKTVNRLLDAGVEVMVIADIPRANEHYRRCLIRGSGCVTPREEALGKRRADLEVAREFGERIMLADFTDQMCGPEQCPARLNGVIVYRDTDHLSAAYAATYAPQMAHYLRLLAEKTDTKSTIPAARHDVPTTAAIGEPAPMPVGPR